MATPLHAEETAPLVDPEGRANRRRTARPLRNMLTADNRNERCEGQGKVLDA